MIFITYDSNKKTDGIGAQYQRIIGIICIAFYYNLQYVHNTIKVDGHNTNIENAEKFFGIKEYFDPVDINSYDFIYELENPKENDILEYINLYKNQNILIKILYPFNICDANPQIYVQTMPILTNLIKKLNLDLDYNYTNTNIAIHVRRGDVTKTKNNDRYISTEIIKKIINNIQEKYSNAMIYIFTEITDENKNEFQDIINNKIILKANLDDIYTINHLIFADVLIMSKSSFSYVAGLYNPNKVYYFNFWHSSLPIWHDINNLLYINEAFTNNTINYNWLYILLIIIIIYNIK